MRRLLSEALVLYPAAALVAVLVMAGVFAAGWAAALVDRGAIVDRLSTAADAGVFARTIDQPFGGDRPIPLFSGNDCRVLASLILPYPDAAAEAVTNLMPVEVPLKSPPPDNGIPRPPCLRLMEILDTADRGTVETYAYHRYILGQRTVARVLATVVSPQTLGWLTLGGAVALLLAIPAVAAWRLLRGAASRRDLAFTGLAAALLLFYGLPVYGRYFTFGLPDMVIAGMLVAGYLVPLGRVGQGGFLVAVAVFGVLTAVFEFLTGGIPLGLALLLALIALGEAPDAGTVLRRAVHAVAVFCIAVVTALAVKVLVVVAVFGTHELAVLFAALDVRMSDRFLYSLSRWDVMRAEAAGFDLTTVERGWVQPVLFMGFRLLDESFRIAFGSPVLGQAVIVGGAAAAPLLIVATLWRGGMAVRAEAVVLGASLLVPIVWYLAFLNHTILHAVWMVRPLVWFPALALVLAIRLPPSRRAG
ncbi:hypothetical protein [Azospirillum halopraeferens]|uniref:hypothetical protein n=1 Tax=Azospirillum halopraeferens TaxID=34010 RepID=UPI0004108258|nr:hypothetical protein [Azospirillum halopraeferens]